MNDNDSRFLSSDESQWAQIIMSEVVHAIHKFFDEYEFVYVMPPVIHEAISNKKREIYFDMKEKRYSLNSSNALYLSAYASVFERVYSISSCFRDEQFSYNHLNEFHMLEAEIIGMSFDELPDFVEKLISHILKELSESIIIKRNDGAYKRILLIKESFHPQKMAYDDFLNMIVGKGGSLKYGDDISDNDFVISNMLDKPIMIIDYPTFLATWTAVKKDKTHSRALNLMLPNSFGELCEGCERTNDIELLRHKFMCAGIENLEWYIDAVGSIKKERCGFGIGIERLVRWIVGRDNIQDVVFFPRINF